MTHDRKLEHALSAYRIGDPKGEFPIWDDSGARLSSGRWHDDAPQFFWSILLLSRRRTENGWKAPQTRRDCLEATSG